MNGSLRARISVPPAIVGLLVCASAGAAAPGDLDTGFGRLGVASFDRPLDFAAAGTPYPPREIQQTDLGRTPSGAYLAVGQLRNSPDSGLNSYASAIAVRYTPAGAVDHSFGDAGAFIDGSRQSDFPSLAIDPAGRAHIAAWEARTDGAHAVVMRLAPDGALDTGYGSTGRVDLGRSLWPPAVALQPDGKLLVSGVTAEQPGERTLTVFRLLADGTLDASFGTAGIARLPLGNDDWGRVSALALQPNGRVVVVGSARSADGAIVEFLVARLTTVGSPDASFGTAGILRDRFRLPGRAGTATLNEATSVGLHNGKVVVAGTARAPSSVIPPEDRAARPAVARYTADGQRDSSFGRAGHVTTWLGAEGYVPDDGLLIQRGRVLVIARKGFGTTVVRYLPDGRRDLRFGRDGLAGAAINSPEAIITAANGRFLVGGNEIERCGFGMPVVSFDGLTEPDVRVVGRAALDGRRLRLRLRAPSRRQLVRGVVTAIGERASDTPEPRHYGRPCSVWDEFADAPFLVRGEKSVVIRLSRRDAVFLRRTPKVIVRVTSRAGGRRGATARRVRVVRE